jgi:hypothetical protein
MGFLRRALGGGGPKAPEWASFMSGDEYAAFEAAILDDLGRRGYTARLTGDGGVEAEGGEHPGMYGLFNIAQVCHAAERQAWPGLIRQHFDHLAAIYESTDAEMAIETARPLLRVRIHRVADTQPEMLELMVRRLLAPDLVAALALDMPTSVRTVTDKDVEHWATPIAELYAIGTANLADELHTYQREQLDLSKGRRIEVLYGDSFFVASQAIRFAELAGETPHGALLAMPNRHQLLWHVIESADGAIEAVNGLVQQAAGAYEDGPGSLTPDVYWWRAGAFTLIPAVVDRRRGINVMPPEEFVQLLNSLA